MHDYVLKRVLLMIPTLVGVSFLVFSLLRIVPGDTVMALVAESTYVSQEDIERLRGQLGVDRPFLTQYFSWITGVLTLDWGTSLWTGLPVSYLLWESFKVTVELVLLATGIALLVAIPLGALSALRQDTAADYSGRVFAVFGLSLPNFWLAILLVLIGSRFLHYLPPIGYKAAWANPWANFQQFIWPALVLAYAPLAAVMARMIRSTMLEVLRQDYVRTARAKGLSEVTVIRRHVLKNAFIPVLTLLGLSFARLLGGTVIIESIFALPGLGRTIYAAILDRDYPVVQGGVLLIAFIMVFSNLVVDLLYAWLDPRIRYT